jgi:CDP-diacylglycerol--glycerol-3-phosphate 3-phosphatidyltransferase
VLVVVLLTRSDASLLVGLLVFALAVATDYLDGYFARRRNQVTKLGILLDPIADKLLTTAAFLALVDLGDAPAWMVMIILGREFAVTGLRNIAAGKGVIIAASALGKGKMVVQVVAVFLLLLSRLYPALGPLGDFALWAAVVVAIVSGVDYFQRFWRDAFRGPQAATRAATTEPGQQEPLERHKAV